MHANALQKLFVRFVRVIALVAFTVLPTHLLAQPGLGSIESVGWNNTGTKVAVGYNTGLVEVIDFSTSQLLLSFQLPSIVEVDWSPHDSDLLAVSAAELDGPVTIFILNTATGQEILAVTGGDLIYSISWKPDGSRIA